MQLSTCFNRAHQLNNRFGFSERGREEKEDREDKRVRESGGRVEESGFDEVQRVAAVGEVCAPEQTENTAC